MFIRVMGTTDKPPGTARLLLHWQRFQELPPCTPAQKTPQNEDFKDGLLGRVRKAQVKYRWYLDFVT